MASTSIFASVNFVQLLTKFKSPVPELVEFTKNISKTGKTCNDFFNDIMVSLNDMKVEGKLKQFFTELYRHVRSYDQKDENVSEIINFIQKSSTEVGEHTDAEFTELLMKIFKPCALLYQMEDVFFRSPTPGMTSQFGDECWVMEPVKGRVTPDPEGKVYKATVEAEKQGIDYMTPKVREELEKARSQFVPIEPEEDDLKPISVEPIESPLTEGLREIVNKMKTPAEQHDDGETTPEEEEVESITGGVKVPPRPLPQTSYSAVARRSATPSASVTSMEPVAEEPVVEDSDEEEEEPEVKYVEGTLAIVKSHDGDTMAFINTLKIEGNKIFRNVDQKRIYMKSIVCTIFKGYDEYDGRRVRVPVDMIQPNTKKGRENQFWPKSGFIYHLDVKEGDGWTKIFKKQIVLNE